MNEALGTAILRRLRILQWCPEATRCWTSGSCILRSQPLSAPGCDARPWSLAGQRLGFRDRDWPALLVLTSRFVLIDQCRCT